MCAFLQNIYLLFYLKRIAIISIYNKKKCVKNHFFLCFFFHLNFYLCPCRYHLLFNDRLFLLRTEEKKKKRKSVYFSTENQHESACPTQNPLVTKQTAQSIISYLCSKNANASVSSSTILAHEVRKSLSTPCGGRTVRFIAIIL